MPQGHHRADLSSQVHLPSSHKAALATPVNALVNGAFPDFSLMVNKFTASINTFLGTSLAYFFNILPPTTRTVIQTYLALLVVYYTISISLHAILKVYTIIRNIKIW